MMFRCLQARVLMFNRLHALWPKDYRTKSLGKSHQIRDYLKQAMQKSYPSAGFEPAAYGLLLHCSTT